MHERVNAGWEEHVCSVRLAIKGGFLEHDGDNSAEVDEHGEFGLRGLVFV